MANLPCPACDAVLVGVVTASGVVAACEACGGQWLDNAASQAISLNDLAQPARNLVNPRVQPPPKGHVGGMAYRQSARGPDATRSCPMCRAVLEARVTDEERFGAGITVDVCAAHGTWFDRGEAWALLQRLAIKHQEAELARRIEEAGGGGAQSQTAVMQAMLSRFPKL